jgi:rhodopsin domain-containing protein
MIYSPVQAYWVFPPIQNATCLNVLGVVFTGSINKNVLEFVLITLPIPLIARLNTSKRRKQAAAVLLCMGYIIFIDAVVRLYFTWEMLTQYDQTWSQYPAFLAGSVETHLGVVSFNSIFDSIYEVA